MTREFLAANAALLVAQAGVVALPGQGVPRAIARLRTGGRALLGPACVIGFVIAGTLGPDTAVNLSRLALVAVPVLAATALAWGIRGAHPVLAVLAVPLVLLAFARPGTLPGAAAAAALSALSCVPIARLIAGAVPAAWLKLGLLAWAVYDAVTVFANQVHPPDALVDGALAAAGLPRFQVLDLHAASLGYADVFVAAVLGALLASERARAAPVAALVLMLSIAFDALFLVFDTLPATVPVALALVVTEIVARRPTVPSPRRGTAREPAAAT